MATQISKRIEFISAGLSYVAIEVTSGQIEIYGFYADGMEKFLGYLTDLCIPGVLRMRATAALYSGGAKTFRKIQLDLAIEA